MTASEDFFLNLFMLGTTNFLRLLDAIFEESCSYTSAKAREFEPPRQNQFLASE